MGRRSRRQPKLRAPSSDYTDAEGNVLTLRDRLPRRLEREVRARPGASTDDAWQRQEELFFERLAVSWTIAGLPITDQRELLGRYRMADSDTRRWVRKTIDEHIARLSS